MTHEGGTYKIKQEIAEQTTANHNNKLFIFQSLCFLFLIVLLFDIHSIFFMVVLKPNIFCFV